MSSLYHPPSEYGYTPHEYVAVIFIVLFDSCTDIIALLVQAAGGSIAAAATTPDRAQLGAHNMLGGIIFQFAAMVAYCVLTTEFLVRYAQDRPLRLHIRTRDQPVLQPGTKHMIYAVAFSTLVLSIRSIYRIIELTSGWQSGFMLNELYFNVLDGAMVVVATFTINLQHSGRLLGSRETPLPAEYGMKLSSRCADGSEQPGGMEGST
ncbi:RTA1 like protein-domain-containing protein [Mycena olivaceomarginata]|nr:RTA1 like protein-domain-containing protein [Mycena olivaceomarginata]